MGKVNLTISDNLEEKFRPLAFKVKGMKKGFLTDATEEAVALWVDVIQNKDKGDEKLLEIVKKRLGMDG